MENRIKNWYSSGLRLSIRVVLLAFLLLIGGWTVIVSLLRTHESFQAYRQSQNQIVYARMATTLMSVSRNIMFERGRTLVILRSPEKISDQNRLFIDEHRHLSETAWLKVQDIRGSLNEAEFAELLKKWLTIKQLRAQVDHAVVLPLAARDPELAARWFAALNDFINEIRVVTSGKIGKFRPGDNATRAMLVAASAQELRNAVGVDVSIVAQALAANKTPPEERLYEMHELRGKEAMLWQELDRLTGILSIVDLSETVKKIKELLLTELRPMQDKTLANLKSVDGLKVTFSQFTAVSTPIQDDISLLMISAEVHAIQLAEESKEQSKSVMIENLASAAFILLLLALAIYYVTRHVVLPLERVNVVLRRLMENSGEESEKYGANEIERINASAVLLERTLIAKNENFAQILRLNEQLEINARDLEDQAVELEASQDQIKKTEAWYRGIVRSAPDGIIVVNERGNIVLVNDILEKMFGYEDGELIGEFIEVLVPVSDRIGHVSKRQDFVASEASVRPMNRIMNTLRGCRKDGSEFPVDIALSKLPDVDGRTNCMCVTVRDISEIKQAEQELRLKEYILDHAYEAIYLIDTNLQFSYVNNEACRSLGYRREELLGLSPSDIDPDTTPERAGEIQAQLMKDGQVLIETRHRRRDGSLFEVEMQGSLFEYQGKVMNVAFVRDITELNEHRKHVHLMAFYDSLTTLPNRALYNDRLRQMIADASWHGQQAGVMLLDLDRFKAVNDTLGHPAGDALLREAALRLTASVRGYDTVARLGGDEFAILLPEVRSGDDLGRVANKIIDAFKEPFLLEGKEVFVTTSIGIAVYPLDSEDADDLLKQADSAMYFAKKSGRNTFRYYSKDLSVISNERLLLEGDMRRGFGRGEFELFYQPKVRLSDGLMIGSEVLLRWNHPQLGMVPPDKFISIAEDSGMIIDIGAWVLRDACRVACEWNAQGKSLHKVAINLSARQFQSNDLVSTVHRALKDTHCHPEWIELEITESLLMDEDSEVMAALQKFREMGITIAIDDFGTGYSSLSYLALFPIDTLKIDRSFTNRVTNGGHHSELVKAIISIAKSLNQKVVAEGVETVEQAAILQAYGCDIAQGYLYSKPVPREVFEALPRSF